MSTSTQAQPPAAVPARLLSVPLAATFLAEFTSLTSFFLLLSVMPMLTAPPRTQAPDAQQAGGQSGTSASGGGCRRAGRRA